MADALEANPTLTTSELACRQGLSFHPGAADLSVTHQGRIGQLRQSIIKKSGTFSKGLQVFMDMEKIDDKVDAKNASVEGSDTTANDMHKLDTPICRIMV